MPFQDIIRELQRVKNNTAASVIRKTVEKEHDEIHEGESFIVDVFDATMADTDTIIIAFKTGTRYPHMTIEFDSLVGAHLTLNQGGTWDSSSGTAGTPVNRNFNSSTTSTLLGDQSGSFVAGQVVLNPTNPTGGTNKITIYEFGNARFGSSRSRGRNEFVLMPNTTYIITLTADGASNAGQIILDWYEEE